MDQQLGQPLTVAGGISRRSSSLTKAGSAYWSLTANVRLGGSDMYFGPGGGNITLSGGTLSQPGGKLLAVELIVDGGAYSLSGTGQLGKVNYGNFEQYVGYSGSGSFRSPVEQTPLPVYSSDTDTAPSATGTYTLITAW